MSTFELPTVSTNCRPDLIADIHAMPASKQLSLPVYLAAGIAAIQ